MSSDFEKKYQRERNAKANRWLIGCILAYVAILGYGAIDKYNKDKAENAEKERTEARAQAFAHYIIDDAYADATHVANTQDASYVRNLAKNNPQELTQWIQNLQADSAKYANAIIRDATIIHEIDNRAGKAVDFATALEIVRNMPKDSYRPKYEREYVEQSDGDIECVGLRPVEGTKVYQGATQSRILTINQRELKKICTQLIVNRTAMQKSR